MRKTELEVKDRTIIGAILDESDVVTISMCDGDKPYAVPMNFGYVFEEDQLVLYLHCALEGKKLDVLKNNPNVCANTFIYKKFLENKTPIQSRNLYCSVMAFGILSIVTDKKEFIKGCRLLLKCTKLNGKNIVTKGSIEKMKIAKIICPMDEVTGKTKIPIKSISELKSLIIDA